MAEILGHDDLYTKRREYLVLRVCVQWALTKDRLAQEGKKPGTEAFPELVQLVRFPYIPFCTSGVKNALTVRFFFLLFTDL
jgi:hypothetical protein